jgi:hypothetical protein
MMKPLLLYLQAQRQRGKKTSRKDAGVSYRSQCPIICFESRALFQPIWLANRGEEWALIFYKEWMLAQWGLKELERGREYYIYIWFTCRDEKLFADVYSIVNYLPGDSLQCLCTQPGILIILKPCYLCLLLFYICDSIFPVCLLFL